MAIKGRLFGATFGAPNATARVARLQSLRIYKNRVHLMIIWIRSLIAALLVWQLALAQAQGATVTERLQWNDALDTSILPPSGDVAWQAADKEIRRGFEAGTLWVRLRVTAQAQEDLYLALRQVSVDDLAVGVQYPAAADSSRTLE